MTLDVGLEQIIALMVQTGSPEHWIAAIGSDATVTGGALDKDSAGNIWLAGSADSNDLLGCSVQDTGILRSQFQATISSYAQTGISVGLDSSDNTYWLGQTDSFAYPNTSAYLIKRNSAGVVQWERTFGTAFVPKALTVDSSGNSYVVGQGPAGALAIKYSTSGAVTWAKTMSGGSFHAVALTGSDLYCAGHTEEGAPSSSSDLYLVKLSASTGAVSWQRSLGGANKDVAFGVCVDTDGDVVVGGICDSGGTEGLLIAKYTSSGTLSWQRKIVTGGTFANGGYIAPGASGTVYVVGTISDSVNKLLVAQIADAGTVTWQNKLTPTGANAAGRAVYRDATGLYVVGDMATDIMLAKLMDDGTLTGTHGDYTYATSAQSTSSPGLTGDTPVNTASDAAGSSSVTGTYSAGTLTLSRTVVT